jgi:TIR domain
VSYKVFLSHSASDRPWAEWILNRSAQVGIEIYLFEHDPKPGTLVAAKIQGAIQNSDAVIVLLTHSGASSAYVQQEIGYAAAARRLIIPLVWPGQQKKGLAMLDGVEWVPFDPSNADQALVRILKYLEQLKTKKESAQAILALGALIIAAFSLSRRS